MRRPLVIAACVLTLAGCGSSEASDSFDYTTFCAKAAELETAAQDTHMDDPAAISDTKVMADNWTKSVARAVELRDASPEDIKEDVTLMVSTLIDMNDVFKKNDYNLLEMAKSEEIRKQLDAISSRKGVTEASARFNTFMEKNCAQQ